MVNALVAAEDMTGRDNHKVIALPHDQLREVLKKYNRLAPTAKNKERGYGCFTGRKVVCRTALRFSGDVGSMPKSHT